MTEKEALEFMILFDATWYIVVFAFVFACVVSFFRWLSYRSYLNQECLSLSQEVASLKRLNFALKTDNSVLRGSKILKHLTERSNSVN